jgi:hypothetical protein
VEPTTPKLITCKEAAELLRSGKVGMLVQFRPPDLFLTVGKYKDSDPAYLWEQ